MQHAAPPPQPPQPHQPHQPPPPPICGLLIAEANFWHSLSQLHASALHAAQQIAEAATEPQLTHDAEDDARESAYIASLTSLASNFEQAAAECLKIRSVRLTRRELEARAESEIVRSHAAEVRAVGTALANRTTGSCSNVAALLRGAAQRQRNQVASLNQLIGVLASAKDLPLPASSELVLGIKSDGILSDKQHTIASVLQTVYEHGETINETSVSAALSSLYLERSPAPAASAAPARFTRRSIGSNNS